MAHGKHRRARATTQRNPKVASFKARLREGLQVPVDELLHDVDTETPDALDVATAAMDQMFRRLYPVLSGDPQLIEQNHMLHDGDATEQVFNLMACVHPAQCSCETEYPNWKPGLR